MNFIKEYKFFIVLFWILIGLFSGMYVRHIEIKTNTQAKIAKCEAAGYIWLIQEGKCIMIKEYK